MSTTNQPEQSATMEHQSERQWTDRQVTIDPHVQTNTISTAAIPSPKPNLNRWSSIIPDLNSLILLQPNEFGKVIVTTVQTTLKHWNYVHERENSVSRLTSKSDTSPPIPVSLKSKCPLKVSDRFKDNQEAQIALATYQEIHDEHSKKLAKGALVIARIELKLANGILQDTINSYLCMLAENLLIIDRSEHNGDQWSTDLSIKERVALVSLRTINRLAIQPFDSLPFENHSKMTIAMYTHLELDAPTTVSKLTDSNKLPQTRLACICFDLFVTGTIIQFWTQEEEIREKRLEADLKAHNICKKQDQANRDVEIALEKESDKLLQTNALIQKTINKKMHSLLSKLQSLETKLAKNSTGGRWAQMSQPKSSGNKHPKFKNKPMQANGKTAPKQTQASGKMATKQAAKRTTPVKRKPHTPRSQTMPNNIKQAKKGYKIRNGKNDTPKKQQNCHANQDAVNNAGKKQKN